MKGKNVERVTIKLYRAVEAYVKLYGGTVVVAGGVSTEKWPEDLPGNYFLRVRCTGRMPDFFKFEQKDVVPKGKSK